MADYSLLTPLGTGMAVTRSGDTLNTSTAHYLRAGNRVELIGTGSAGNLTVSTTGPGGTHQAYYVLSSGLTSTAFKVSLTAGGTPVTLAANDGVTKSIIGEYWNNLPASSGANYRSRYGSVGSERVYGSYNAWKLVIGNPANKSAGTALVLEVEGAFDDTSADYALGYTISGYASIEITSKLNGTYGSAFHAGVPGAGYVRNVSNDQYVHCFAPNNANPVQSTFTVDGLEGYQSNTGAGKQGTAFWATEGCTYKNCIGRSAPVAGSTASAFYEYYASNRFENCIAFGSTYGFYSVAGAGANSLYKNNTAYGNTTGFYTNGTAGSYNNANGTNNVSVGNTTNWGANVPLGLWTNNIGESGNAVWTVGTGSTSLTTGTTANCFVNAASNNFSIPAASPRIDAGTTFSGAYTSESYDITNAIQRPAYNNGGAEVQDLGAHEYDLGYGLRPVTRDLVFTGAVTGSQIVVYTTNTTTELQRNDSTSGDETYHAGATGVTVDYTILKAGYDPIRVTGVSLMATTTTVTVQQQAQRAYVAGNGSSLTFGTNVIVNVSSRVVTSMQVSKACTPQNWYSYLMDSWIASSTNTTLKNVAFPVKPFGEASFTLVSGIEFSDGATSIGYFSRDGIRYASDAGGVTETAKWAAILSLGTDSSLYVKYRQATSGSITTLSAAGVMDKLIQVMGDSAHGNFDYTGYLQLKAPLPGWSNPKADVYATYGAVVDGLYVAALAPVQQWACTNADIDASHLVLDNTAKTYVVSASHSIQELYQRAQWWSCQDAQWNADTPMSSSDGATFTLYTGWNLSGLNYVTGTQTLTGGAITLAGPGTYTPTFSSTTVVAQGEGTYTFTASNIVLNTTPTADDVHYVLGNCTLSGTLTVHNQNAHPITVEVPAGVTTSSTGNTGGAVTFVAPVAYQSVTVSGAASGSRIQIYDTTSSTELYNGTPTFPYTWTDGSAAVASRDIRLRVAKMSGATAKNFIDVNIGTCGTSGGSLAVSYLVNQSDDSTYNTNAIDGSTVTGITIDIAGGNRVKINIAGGGVTWASIYAYQVYWQATSTGIAQETAFISAPDTANYLLTDFDLKNTHATIPLTVTGGWGRDAVTGLSKDIIDTTGTYIFLAPDHVIPYSTGSGLTAGQAAELTAASSSAASAATLAAAIPTNPLLTNDSRITTLVTKLTEVHQMDGLDSGNPVTVDATSRSSGTIAQTIAGTDTVVLTRTA